MRIRSKSDSWPPPKYRRRLLRRILELRQHLTQDVEIDAGENVYRFRCETVRELNRCLKVFAKEPGTLDWIRTEMKPGQVFYDIGANIGVYTVLAAHRVGAAGRVYAFEPHGPNFARLLANVACNRLEGVVVPCSLALNDRSGYLDFTYDSAAPGTSNSQLGERATAAGASQGLIELKPAAAIDDLLVGGTMPAPHHVKIDVDGNEHLILRGMAGLLASDRRPLSIQVELNEPHAAATTRMLEAGGYVLAARHYTRSAARRRESGEETQDGCNGVFRRAD